MSLELEAIGPYLARLGQSDRDGMILRLAPRYFGQANESHKELDDVAAAGLVRGVEGSDPKPD